MKSNAYVTEATECATSVHLSKKTDSAFRILRDVIYPRYELHNVQL